MRFLKSSIILRGQILALWFFYYLQRVERRGLRTFRLEVTGGIALWATSDRVTNAHLYEGRAR
jgi:hypothetical protein